MEIERDVGSGAGSTLDSGMWHGGDEWVCAHRGAARCAPADVRWVLAITRVCLTSSAIVSLTLFSRSSVACRRARRPDVEGCVPFFLSSSEENMTLYRSISVDGISTAKIGLSPFEFTFGVMAVHSSST